MNQYYVHVYHVVRTKISIEAENHVDAMKKADEFIPNIVRSNIPFEAESQFQGHGTIHHTESAEEVTGYLVDEVGDTEYQNTRSYDDDYSPTKSGPKLLLFMIVHSDDDGNNWDALIEAPDAGRATELWREAYWGSDADEDYIPERIFVVSPTGEEGMLAWDSDQLELIVDNR